MPDVMPIVAASVALFILVWLASIALYAMPESDDYCVTNRVNSMGLVGMVKSYYLHQMGRLTSLVAIAAPAVVSKVTGVDYVVVYPVILICGMAIFLAVSVYWAGRMWTGLSWPERFLAGAMLCAASFVLAISLREMLYWISGSASYMVPALFVIIILVELVRSAANETVLSTGQIVVLSAIGFLGALANEFTPFWIVALVAGSALYRAFYHPRPQLAGHAAMLTATFIGLAILLLSPGNAVRMAAYPEGGKIAASFSMGLYYLWLELVRHYTESATWAWLGFVALFSVFVVPSQPRPAARLLVLIVGLVAAVLAGLYTAYVIAYFATAEDLATRGRNEVVVFLLAGGGCAVALAARFLPSLGHHAHVRMTALVACGLLSFLLLDSVALGYVRAEESQFATFWSESVQRHQFLRTTKDLDVVVPKRSVKPSMLMDGELTKNPGQLPNDCVGEFYGKRSVVLGD
jgi:hypothetical protein